MSFIFSGMYETQTTKGAFGKNLVPAGVKLGQKAFEGRLGLQGRVLSGASLLAQQGQLGKNKNR